MKTPRALYWRLGSRLVRARGGWLILLLLRSSWHFEVAARAEGSQSLAAEYMGSFPNTSGNSEDTFEIAVEVDAQPKLNMFNYTVNSVDMREVFAQIYKVGRNELQMLLFSSQLRSPGPQQTQQQGSSHRGRSIPRHPKALQGAVFSSPRCNEWYSVGGNESRNSY